MKFVDGYFEAVSAKCVYQDSEYREYELPLDVDKELIERPFYWMWVEASGQEAQTTQLRLAFTQNALERENQRLQEEHANAMKQTREEFPTFFGGASRSPKAELLDYGSFRLDKIFSSVANRGQFIVCQPSPILQKAKQRTLIPWLLCNGVTTMRCDLTKQMWWSMGVCLQNGQIVPSFYEQICHLEMVPMSPQRLLSQMSMPLDEALNRAMREQERLIKQLPTDWAEKARQRFNAEYDQLKLYYRSLRTEDTQHNKQLELEEARKIESLAKLYIPTVEVEVVQLGLVGLPESTTASSSLDPVLGQGF